MKALTLEEAQNLKPGDILYATKNNNSDGTPARWRVNGQVKLWKTDSNRVYVPLKRGLYNYDTLTEKDFIDGICEVLSLEAE